MKTKTLLIFVVIIILSFVFVACGSAQDKKDSLGTPSDAGARAEKVVTFYADKPTDLDPHRAGDVSSAKILVEVYSGLLSLGEVPSQYVEYNTEGYPTLSEDVYANMPQLWQSMARSMIDNPSQKNVVLLPDLAEKIPSPEFNKDGTVSYVFTIRPDAKFSNGKPITSQDVKFSFERALDPRLNSTTAELYLSNIKGALERLYDRENGWKKDVEGIEVLDERTVKITANKFTVEFLWQLTYPTGFVVNPIQAGKDPSRNQTWVKEPIASGAFFIEETDRSKRTVLRKNPHSYKGPKIDKIIMKHNIPSDTFSEFEQGIIDLIGVGKDLVDKVRDPGHKFNKYLIQGKSFDIFYIGFHTDKPPFDDPILRRAFAMAIDKEGIAKHIVKNLVLPAYGFIPPGIAGYNRNLEGIRFNPEKAKELFSQSRYYSKERGALMVPVRGAGGEEKIEPFRFVLGKSGENPEQGEFLTVLLDEWKRIFGIEIETNTREYAQYLLDLRYGKHLAFWSGWALDYPDASNVTMLFYSDVSTANRTTFFSNSEFDQLFRQAQVERDPDKRANLFKKMNEILATDVPAIPLVHDTALVLVQPRVKGYTTHSIIIPKWHLVDVE